MAGKVDNEALLYTVKSGIMCKEVLTLTDLVYLLETRDIDMLCMHLTADIGELFTVVMKIYNILRTNPENGELLKKLGYLATIYLMGERFDAPGLFKPLEANLEKFKQMYSKNQ